LAAPNDFPQFFFGRIGQDVLNLKRGVFAKRARRVHPLERYFDVLSQLRQQIPCPVLLYRAKHIALHCVQQLAILGRHVLLKFFRDEFVQPDLLLPGIGHLANLARVIGPQRKIPFRSLVGVLVKM
jgi:hypothetical protein